ncbi:MAG: hypothetical protein Q8R16_01765 [bacterium]|nr:hypothetical protein [bacterium]
MPRSPLEEFCDRLDQHGSRVAKVKLYHNPQREGGTLVVLSSGANAELDRWYSEVLLDDDALHELRKRFAQVEPNDDAGDVQSFIVHVPRRRGREEARP